VTLWAVLLAGALVGAGATTFVAGLVPAEPDLAAAMDRILPADGAALRREPSMDPTGESVLARTRRRALPRAAETLGLRRYASDLRMVDGTVESLAARKLGHAAVGLAAPALFSAILWLLGVRLPFTVPTVAGLALAATLFMAPDLELRKGAAAARSSMRRAACVFLELVALERAADAGTTEALDRAATIGGSREFARIRDALLRAELAGQPSWTGLTGLAESTGVPELGDLADIMRVAGQDGAAVYSTLRARATSLRGQLLATNTAKANAASEHMAIPVSLLGLCFMALLGYPAFVRILFG
jgi:hypothetical protein